MKEAKVSSLRYLRCLFLQTLSLNFLHLFVVGNQSNPQEMADAKKYVEDLINEHTVMVFSKSYCPYCDMAKKALKAVNANFHVVEIENMSNCQAIQDVLHEKSGARSVSLFFSHSYLRFHIIRN